MIRLLALLLAMLFTQALADLFEYTVRIKKYGCDLIVVAFGMNDGKYRQRSATMSK